MLGAENGKDLFDRLEQEVKAFNDHNEGAGGKAKLQWYSLSEDIDSDVDTDIESSPKPKRKQKLTTKTQFWLFVLPSWHEYMKK